MPNQSHQNTLHLLNCHVHMLHHSTIKHSCWHIPPPTFLLQVSKALEDDTFPVGEPIFHIREIVPRVTAIHGKVPPYRHAEAMATMRVWSSGYTVANSER